MAEHTHISWADATLNFWIGCTEVSNGEKGACVNCYARTWSKRFPRYQGTWGHGAPRVQTVDCLSKAKKLQKLAILKRAAGGGAFFCFSNSLSDIFDNEVPIEWLAEAFAVMRATPEVTYLLLTKRAPNILKRAAAAGGLPPNAALGITIVTQEEADRDIPHLLLAKVVLKPAFVFLSMEPLMGPVDLTKIVLRRDGCRPNEMSHRLGDYVLPLRGAFTDSPCIDWVITGGESGVKARITPLEAFRGVRDQCAEAHVPYEHKQNGEWIERSQSRPMPNLMVPGPDRITICHHTDGRDYQRVGKEAAGDRLDGVSHHTRPRVPAHA